MLDEKGGACRPRKEKETDDVTMKMGGERWDGDDDSGDGNSKGRARGPIRKEERDNDDEMTGRGRPRRMQLNGATAQITG